MENEDRISKETGDRGQFCHKYLFYASRPLLQAILLVTFLTYFGLPAIARYQALLINMYDFLVFGFLFATENKEGQSKRSLHDT